MGKLLIDRLREPSTMAGLAAIALMFGAHAEQVQAVTTAIASAAAALAVLLPERGTTTIKKG